MLKNKIVKIIKSRITIGVVCFLLGGAILGGKTNNTTTSVDQGKNQEVNVTQNDNAVKEGNKKDKNSSKLIEMNAGESYDVTTKSGDYKVAIEGIRFTDQRNQFSEKPAQHVVFLDFNYENVSSTEEVYLFDSHFKVMDDKGNVLDTYPVSDEARSSKKLPIGGKCSSTATYAMPSSSKTLKVLFYDNMYGSPLGEITLETGL